MSTRLTDVIDDDFATALILASFRLTGNEDMIRTPDTEVDKTRITIKECKTKRFLWKKWTSCDDKYYPDGYIRVNTPKGVVPVKGVKVRMWRWFSYSDAYTDVNGYYISSYKWNSIWIGNQIDYHIVFDGKYDYPEKLNNSSIWNLNSQRWSMNKSLFGALCLWTNYYNAGRHHPTGHSLTFYTNSGDWGRCILHNAIYDYNRNIAKDSLTYPPTNLDIANKKSSDYTSSAPLLKNHLNFSLIYGSSFWGAIATYFSYSVFGWGMPDLILRFENKIDDYNKIVTTVWHELTHASQLQAMKKNKGFWWASDYWSKNVYRQVSNSDTYGKKGDPDWQIIALSEGWANFIEWHLAKNKLGYNTIAEEPWQDAPKNPNQYRWKEEHFPISSMEMYYLLHEQGVYLKDLEKIMSSSRTIARFKEDLVEIYPKKESEINNIIEAYE